MVVPVLVVAVLVFLGVSIFASLKAAQRKTLLAQLRLQVEKMTQETALLKEQSEERARQLDEIRSKHDQAKEEAKKAKKKAFELVQQMEKESVPEKETSGKSEEDLLAEARAETHRAKHEAAQAAKEALAAMEQIDKLKEEMQAAKQTIQVRHEEVVRAERGESERMRKVEEENEALKKKIEVATRKAKTDSQVYRITKSKLELALEKIAYLEKSTGSKSTPAPLAADPAPDASSTPPPPANDTTP
jgi:transgelin